MPRPSDDGHVKNRYLKRIAKLANQATGVLDALTKELMVQSPYEALANKEQAQRLVSRIHGLAMEAQLNLPPDERSEGI